jgi:O-antigen ligase
MGKYKFLFGVYLVALVSYAVANYIGADVQKFYRLPFLDIKWIDIAIMLVIGSFFYTATYKTERIRNASFIVMLCSFYLVFEAIQFYRTWGTNDAASQISHFLCTLSLFVIIDMATFPIPRHRIIGFLKKFAILGAAVLLISNLYLVYSFLTGNVVYEDVQDVRVALEVKGSKETVYSTVLTPFVYAFGLFFLQHRMKRLYKILFISAIISMFAALVITFYRGTFITLLVITVYFLFASGRGSQMLKKIGSIAVLLSLGYFLFGSLLSQKGYDPIEKIVEVAKFTADTENPEWDKGRTLSQAYALHAFSKAPWTGYGYDELFNHGLPEGIATAHNGVITSLFHRGIVGTLLLMAILVLLYKYAINLWKRVKRDSTYESKMIRLLVLVSFFWIIPFMTQEALWEKFSFCVQMIYFGLILNYYKQITQPAPAHSALPLVPAA